MCLLRYRSVWWPSSRWPPAPGSQDSPNVALVLYSGSMKFALIAIPLFILAGGHHERVGISRRLINLASALVGFIRGGLAWSR